MAYYRCLSLQGYAPAAIEPGPGGVPAPHAALAPCFGGKYLPSSATDWILGREFTRAAKALENRALACAREKTFRRGNHNGDGAFRV
jgi:hypothetical protein